MKKRLLFNWVLGALCALSLIIACSKATDSPPTKTRVPEASKTIEFASDMKFWSIAEHEGKIYLPGYGTDKLYIF